MAIVTDDVATTSQATIPPRLPYGGGVYRRRIELRAGERWVEVDMVDDFHEFSLTLHHDDREIVRVEADPLRIPWVTCPTATEPLRRMQGAPISAPLVELYGFTAAREQCTHMHDLACLAATHAARVRAGGCAVRRFDAALPDRVDDATHPSLQRDGEQVLEWRMRKYRIVESTPADFSGHHLASAQFRDAMFGARDRELGEAAFVLQRAVFIGGGRMHDFEAMPSAAAFASVIGGACHSFAAQRADQALRVQGTVRDFSDEPAARFELRRDGSLGGREEPPDPKSQIPDPSS